MQKDQEILVETELFTAVSAFHDADDKKKREKYVKEYTLEFCKKYNIDPMEAVGKLKDMFEDRRNKTMFKYEHYKDDSLDKIILDEEEK
ncbi:MAG: hypothetical protein IKN74_06520 [Clostridia bacterium]|nr:hypothetical protein [Clostridia bacterium]